MSTFKNFFCLKPSNLDDNQLFEIITGPYAKILFGGLQKKEGKGIKLRMAGGQGFEPWLTGPEPVVLPLYYPPTELLMLPKSVGKSRNKITS